MIPIKDAISSKVWLHCEIYLGAKFRIKVLAFKKLNLLEVDNPEKIHFQEKLYLSPKVHNPTIWIMDLEVVNFAKEQTMTVEMYAQLYLVDQNGAKFYVFQDSHLNIHSDFAKKSKISRFIASVPAFLIPKIKAVGALPFLLSNDDDAEYSISISRGSVKEI